MKIAVVDSLANFFQLTISIQITPVAAIEDANLDIFMITSGVNFFSTYSVVSTLQPLTSISKRKIIIEINTNINNVR